jgi:replicative DNA helicase
MGAAEMGTRAIANELKLDGQGLAFGNRSVIEAARKGAAAMRDWPLYADFTSANIGRVTARLLEWRHKHGIQLAVVDHIQLTERGKGTNRHQDLSEFSRAMKQLAMRLDMPILLVSQISREVEKEGRRPFNADLRESGDLEQNADIILFTHRVVDDDEGDRYELLLSKQRNGPGGKVIDMWVDGRSYRVGEMNEARTGISP